ncbi:MAG: prefoldin subunit alpha [Halobacteriota archaeon]
MEERESDERRREQETEMQTLVLTLRQYQAQAEATTQELLFVQQAIAEHDKAIATIKQLRNLKPGDELIVPIGANSSVYVTLSTADKVIVMIGGGISAEKDPESSARYLKEKKDELEKSQQEIARILQRIEQEAQKLQVKLQELASSGASGQGQR